MAKTSDKPEETLGDVPSQETALRLRRSFRTAPAENAGGDGRLEGDGALRQLLPRHRHA